jgi:integrase/recombinase XerC
MIAYDNAVCTTLTTIDQLPSPLKDPVAQLVTDFLAGRKPTTFASYSQGLRDFARFLGVERIDQAAGNLLTQGPGPANQLVLRYRDHMVDHGLSVATTSLRLAAIRSLVRLARVVGLVTWSLEVRNLRDEGHRDTRGPGTDGVRRLLGQAGAHRSVAHAARDVALVRLMYDLGLRRGSITSLDLEHLDLESGRVWVMLKGHTQRTSRTLPEPTRDALREWLRHRGGQPGALFTNFDRAGSKGQRLTGRSLHRIVQRLGADVGMSVHPHSLRHSAITAALDATNGNIRAVAKFSGHADVRVIERYDDARQDLAGQVARKVAESV